MSNPTTVTASEAAISLGEALNAVSRAQQYDARTESEDLQLSVEIGELARLQTVMSAVLRDVQRRKQDLERRQQALESVRQQNSRRY